MGWTYYWLGIVVHWKSKAKSARLRELQPKWRWRLLGPNTGKLPMLLLTRS
jgi:hypothetical protein